MLSAEWAVDKARRLLHFNMPIEDRMPLAIPLGAYSHGSILLLLPVTQPSSVMKSRRIISMTWSARAGPVFHRLDRTSFAWSTER